MKHKQIPIADVSISVITATFNSESLLPRLLSSLTAQTDSVFEWIVADGGSSDRTLDILSHATSQLHALRFTSQSDFGIYDALNRAICNATGLYYIVLGSDDILYPDSIFRFKQAIAETGADMITASIASNGRIRSARNPHREWLYGQFAHISGHSVGVAIKRSLHNDVGFYSNKYPIAADQLFVMTAVSKGAYVSRANFISGCFEQSLGTSGQDILGSTLETFRIQIQLGQSIYLQLLLLFLRLLLHFPKLVKERT